MKTQSTIASLDSRAAAGARPSVPETGVYLFYKHAVDFVISLALLALSAPVFLLAVLLVKLTSRGPVFYCQTRLGRGGRPFTIYKLRTMQHNCESLTGPQWSQPGDARVTWLGRFLRRTHIDELPQLWNVMRGDMSLVGPRPERPEFVPQLEQAVPFYRERLLVRPGITGLAQVQLPADTDLTSVRRKLAHDLYYIRSVSAWLDFRILVATAFCVIYVPSYLVRTVLRLPGGRRVVSAYEHHARQKTKAEFQVA